MIVKAIATVTVSGILAVATATGAAAEPTVELISVDPIIEDAAPVADEIAQISVEPELISVEPELIDAEEPVQIAEDPVLEDGSSFPWIAGAGVLSAIGVAGALLAVRYRR